MDGERGPTIATDFYCLDPNQKHFAEEIKRKYEKYHEKAKQYDEFIILGYAASGSGLEISDKSGLEEVINHFLTICPEIISVSTVIAWREADHPEKIVFSWYKSIF